MPAMVLDTPVLMLMGDVPAWRTASEPMTARVDLAFGGRGRISGDVAIKGQQGAPDIPVQSRVRLFRQRDGAMARESGVYAPVAADRRVPERKP